MTKKIRGEVDKELDQFFLTQLPPSMQIFQGLESLSDLVQNLDPGFRYAVEVRHRSCFQELAYNFFANDGICLVWNQLAKTSPVVTTDFLYLRLIGEKDFGRIQIGRVIDKQNWVGNLKTVEDEQIKLAIMTASHYAGFRPGFQYF